jgi:hypothetical protein
VKRLFVIVNMIHALKNRRWHQPCSVLAAWALSVVVMSVGTTSCNVAQRFESAMTDQPASGEEHESETDGAPTVSVPQTDETAATSRSETMVREDGEGEAGATEASTTGALATAVSVEPTSERDGVSADTADAGATSPAPSSVTSDIEPTLSGLTDDAPSSDIGAPAGTATAVETSAETTEPSPLDECPGHETQLVAGSCGCGHAPEPKCDALREATSHRYSFVSHAAQEGYDASTIPDSVGSADGSIHDAAFDWDGSLLMNGDGSYVSLPSGLLSSHVETTIDFWLKWWGGSDNQRLLNFGLAPNDSEDAPDNYLSISPSGSNGVLTVQYRTNGDERGDKLEASDPLVTSDLQHVTVVIRKQSLSLFVNGKSEATVDTVHRLSDLDDNDNWLGRALYSGYPLFEGAFFELRVFNRALGDDEVAKLDEVGLDLP